jgi:type II secretion system protein H
MQTARQRGFTLIELLVVMVILGITLGLVSLNAIPGQEQGMQQDAKRIALLLQLARDEAIVRNRQIALKRAGQLPLHDPQRHAVGIGAGRHAARTQFKHTPGR